MDDGISSPPLALGAATLSKLDECISTLSISIATSTIESGGSVSALYWSMGRAYKHRYKLSSSADDWEKARSSFDKALSLVFSGSEEYLKCCFELATLHSASFFQLHRLKDGNEAVVLLKLALRSHSDNAAILIALVDTLRFRARRTGSVQDLEESLVLLQKLVDSTSPDDCELPFRLKLQSEALMEKYAITKELKDIDQACSSLRKGFEHRSLKDKDRLKFLETFSLSTLARFQASKDPGDFDTAQEVVQSALRIRGIGVLAQCSLLRDWGKIRSEKYKFSEKKEDLDQAIEKYQEAIELYSRDEGNDSDGGFSCVLHYDAANAMHVRFNMTGVYGDLRKALKEYKNGLESLHVYRLKGSHETEVMLLQGLANAKFQQFKVLKRSSVLDVAIAHHRQCVDLTQTTDIRLATRVLSLTWALHARFDLHRKLKDLEEAQLLIELVLRLPVRIQATPKALLENRLGATYLRLYHLLGEPKSLNAAIEHFAAADAAESEGLVINVATSVNLGTALLRKAEITQNHRDVTLATDQFHEVMQILKPNHPDFSSMLSILAGFLMSVYSITQKPMTGMTGLMFVNISRFVIQNKNILPETVAYKKMQAARLQYELKENVTLARDNLVSATKDLPEAMFLGLNRSDQLRILRNFFWLPSHGAAFSLAAGNTPEEALRLFESSHNIIWNWLLNGNTNTDGLEEDHPELASRVKDLKAQLIRQIPAMTAIEPVITMPPSRQRIDHATLSYKEVLEEIRAKPGFENFLLLPDGSSNLSEYAADGPIIVVNGTEKRSDAIIIRSNGVVVLPLPMCTREAFREKAQELHAASIPIGNCSENAWEAFDNILLWLWTAAAEPILHDLGFLNRDEGNLGKEGLPRVWWMTTGWMSSFPIHAAGDHKKAIATGETCTVIDSTVSSYINTLKSLHDMRKNFAAMQSAPRKSETSMESLIVQMPTTPDSIPLENAATEASTVQALLEGAHISGQILDRPEHAEILSRLKSCTVAHFACNGISDAKDPSLSLLKLQDWQSQPMNVRDLLQSSMIACQLVYLSGGSENAASKAIAQQKESVYLVGGFQMAGVPHVVATLWRIEDPVSVDIAAAFYETLTEAGSLMFDRTAEALRTALLAARKRGVQASLWGAYVHSGP